ncbi:hypothetical protein KUD11_07560 [Roseovarius sp. LXJ103]|uniref:hypothetical protein n=1 Tax=Roseovarius carneus TaxID=2853164 RepID=UPI000D60FEED|nr:hypothetical protein [Roseovarius carneus]MBZ8118505.1 hypothetical protein [Roseovarius carneus]PWE35799.1 hypothetical protein DD563_07415 [Pelagicola sp. LXJ1103]
MSLITPEEDPSGLSNTVASLEKQLRGMCEDLEALSDRVRAEDFDDVKNRSKLLTDIRQWLKMAIEAETQIEQRKQRERGIINGYALDIDAARDSIGCRLDRLRRARCPGRFPRKP